MAVDEAKIKELVNEFIEKFERQYREAFPMMEEALLRLQEAVKEQITAKDIVRSALGFEEPIDANSMRQDQPSLGGGFHGPPTRGGNHGARQQESSDD